MDARHELAAILRDARKSALLSMRSQLFTRRQGNYRFTRTMTKDDLRPADAQVPSFDAPYAPPHEDTAAAFLQTASLRPQADARIDGRAGALVGAIRAHAGGLGGVEDFLREYSLSTKEGLALMVLAEALLRVPDSATADRLIEDKLSAGDFGAHKVRSHALLVSASARALGISARVIGGHETPESILHDLLSRLGRPAGRTATPPSMPPPPPPFPLGPTVTASPSRCAPRPE